MVVVYVSGMGWEGKGILSIEQTRERDGSNSSSKRLLQRSAPLFERFRHARNLSITFLQATPLSYFSCKWRWPSSQLMGSREECSSATP